MKRLPIILAGLTALVLTLCDLEYGFRGLNPDVESDWVSHPSWWQSDFLAEGGFFIRYCAVMASTPFERFARGHLQAYFILCGVFEVVVIGVASLVVFYVVRLLGSFLTPTAQVKVSDI